MCVQWLPNAPYGFTVAYVREYSQHIPPPSSRSVMWTEPNKSPFFCNHFCVWLKESGLGNGTKICIENRMRHFSFTESVKNIVDTLHPLPFHIIESKFQEFGIHCGKCAGLWIYCLSKNVILFYTLHVLATTSSLQTGLVILFAGFRTRLKVLFAFSFAGSKCQHRRTGSN